MHEKFQTVIIHILQAIRKYQCPNNGHVITPYNITSNYVAEIQ